MKEIMKSFTASHTSARESLVPVSLDGDTSGTAFAGEELAFIAPDDAAIVSEELWASGVEGNFPSSPARVVELIHLLDESFSTSRRSRAW